MAVDVNKVNVQILQDNAGPLLSLFARAKETPLPELAERLEAHFLSGKETGRYSNLTICDDCGGTSDTEACPDMCPFCGAAEDPSPTATATDPKKGIDAAAPTMDSGGSGESNDSQNKTQEAQTVKTNTKDMKAAKKKNKKDGGSVAATAEVVESTAPAAPMILAGGNPLSKGKTTADLDEAVKQVNKFKGTTAVELHNLGNAVREIYDADLWRLRVTADGKALYKDFKAFINAEISVSYGMAFQLMGIAKNYTPEAIARYGTSNLQALLSVQKEDQQRIMGLLDEGKINTTREVVAEVTRTRARKGVKTARTGKTGRAAAAASARAGKSQEKAAKTGPTTTIAIPAGKFQVKLFANGNAEKRAKRLGDKPDGILECSNGVKVKVSIRENAVGELYMLVSSSR